jgi:flagellar export protein FliJ
VRQFVFRLERVLKLKRQREQHAEQAQRLARMAVDACLTQEAAARRVLNDAAAAAASRLGQVLDAATWIDLNVHATRLGEALRVAEQRTVEAQEKLRIASEARVKASREVETLQSLRERQLAEHMLAASRAELARLDETALRGWMRQGRFARDVESSPSER